MTLEEYAVETIKNQQKLIKNLQEEIEVSLSDEEYHRNNYINLVNSLGFLKALLKEETSGLIGFYVLDNYVHMYNENSIEDKKEIEKIQEIFKIEIERRKEGE